MKKYFGLFTVIMMIKFISCTSEPVQENADFKPVISDMTSEESENPLDSGQQFSELVKTYENVDRQNWQKPQLVISSLGDLSDKVVADIGAGTGYFTLRILPRAKKVIAVDIDPRMTKFVQRLKQDLEDQFSDKLEVRLAKPDDPKLRRNEVDVIFLSNTYTYIENRIEYFRKIKSSLRKGGKLVVVDFKKKIIPVHPDQDERLALYQVERELMEAGYELINSDDQSLPYQYIVVAR